MWSVFLIILILVFFLISHKIFLVFFIVTVTAPHLVLSSGKAAFRNRISPEIQIIYFIATKKHKQMQVKLREKYWTFPPAMPTFIKPKNLFVLENKFKIVIFFISHCHIIAFLYDESFRLIWICFKFFSKQNTFSAIFILIETRKLPFF